MPPIVITAAQMPAEKLSMSISNPGLTLPSQIESIFFIVHAVRGPMIIAPRNIGAALPSSPMNSTSLVARITPMTPTAPTTPPRTP